MKTENCRSLLAKGPDRLTEAQLQALDRLHDELLRWSRRFNLTAITRSSEIWEKHLYDSLTVVPWLRHCDSLVDLGSGAGFPALPLKIALPSLTILSVDSVGKKIRFQQHMVRTLGLMGYTPLAVRAEQIGQDPIHGGRYACVVSRAFSDLLTFVQLAAPLVRPGGWILAMKGPEGPREVSAAATCLEGMGWQAEDIQELRLPWSGAERTLIRFSRL